MPSKSDARALLPAVIGHYGDPDPPRVLVPADSWKQIIIHLLITKGGDAFARVDSQYEKRAGRASLVYSRSQGL